MKLYKLLVTLFLIFSFGTTFSATVDGVESSGQTTTTQDSLQIVEVPTQPIKTLDEQVKEKQTQLKSLLDKDQLTKQLEEKQQQETTLQVKEQNLNQLQQDIKQTIDSLKNDIQEKETLKVKLDLEQEKSQKVLDQISELEKTVEKQKKQLKDKQIELDTIVPKLKSELEVLKQENTLAIKQLVTIKQEESQKEKEVFEFNLMVLLSVYILFIVFRLIGTYINHKYKPERYQQYLQVFYIFSTIFLTLFTIIMVFVFNRDLLVSLFFLGGAIIVTLKEYTLSFLASIISVKSFSLGDYLTVNGKTGIVSRLGLLSFSVNLVDKYGRRTEETLRISNSVLLGDKELVRSSKYDITEEFIIKDVTKFKNGYLGIKHLVENLFYKYDITRYDFIDIYDEKHGVKILWTQSHVQFQEVRGVLLSKLSEIEYNDYIYEVKTLDHVSNLFSIYNIVIERREKTYRLVVKVLKSQESQFIKDREKFLI